MKKPKILLIALMFFAFNGFLGLDSIGSNLLKKYIFSKIEFLQDFEVDKFNYSYNNFSIVLRKGNNFVNLVGSFFPFNAVYHARFNNMSLISLDYQGRVFSDGNMKSEDSKMKLNGNLIMANGTGNYKATLDDKDLQATFKGNGFDVQQLFYILKFKVPYLFGTTDLNGYIKKKQMFFNFDYNGTGKYQGVVTSLKLAGSGVAKNKYEYNLTSRIYSDIGNGSFILQACHDLLIQGYLSELNLKKLQKITIYPFNQMNKVKFSYHSADKILNFDSDYYQGYYDNKFYVQLKKQSAKRFFDFVNMKPFISGDVTGNIIIGKEEGTFDLLLKNAVFMNSKILNYIIRTSKADLKAPQLIFVKGFFDKNKVTFNVLSKKPGFSYSIKNGTYDYHNGTYDFELVLTKKTKKYFYEIKNGKIKLKKVKNYKVVSSDTLVM